MPDDPLAAELAAIKERSERYITDMALTEWTVAHKDEVRSKENGDA